MPPTRIPLSPPGTEAGNIGPFMSLMEETPPSGAHRFDSGKGHPQSTRGIQETTPRRGLNDEARGQL